MHDELGKLELELRRISPAATPLDLAERLRAVRSQPGERTIPSRNFHWADWLAGWRGVALTTPAAAMVLIAWLIFSPAAGPGKAEASDSSGIKANAVQVGHHLLGSFDTVEKLPDGEPVRFRCRVWQDNVLIRDDAHGVVISQSTPRVVVVPVGFDTE